MFGKKCNKCNNKVNKNYDFCHFCGNNLRSNKAEDDYGFFGKSDIIEEDMFSNLNSGFMDKIIENAMKTAERMIESQMKDMHQNKPQNNPLEGFPGKINISNPGNMDVQFFVNGKRVFPNNEKKQEEMPSMEKIDNLKKVESKISKENIEKLAKFPREEPKSKIRRLAGKVICEIEIPGVKRIEDVLVNKLENSIEIKAIGKDRVYSKNLNVNLPIMGYKLEKSNLILELQAK